MPIGRKNATRNNNNGCLFPLSVPDLAIQPGLLRQHRCAEAPNAAAILHLRRCYIGVVLLQGHGFSTVLQQNQTMKEMDKKGQADMPATTSNEPVQPASTDAQNPPTNPRETPEEDDGFVVVGSGLGIDE